MADGGIVFVGSIQVILHILAIILCGTKFKVLHRDRFERVSIVFFPGKTAVCVCVIIALIFNVCLSMQWWLFDLRTSVPAMIKLVVSDGLLIPIAFLTTTLMMGTKLSSLVYTPNQGGATTSSPQGGEACDGSDDEGGETPDRAIPSSGRRRTGGGSLSSSTTSSQGGTPPTGFGGPRSHFQIPTASDNDDSEVERESEFRAGAMPPGYSRFVNNYPSDSMSDMEGSHSNIPRSDTSESVGSGSGWSPTSYETLTPTLGDGTSLRVQQSAPREPARGAAKKHRGRKRRNSTDRLRNVATYWQDQLQYAVAYFNGTHVQTEFTKPWETTARWNFILKTRLVFFFSLITVATHVGFAITESQLTSRTQSDEVVRCRTINAGNIETTSCVDDIRVNDARPSHDKVITPRVFDAMKFIVTAIFLHFWVTTCIAQQRCIRNIASRRMFRRTFLRMSVVLLARMLIVGITLLNSSRRGAQNAIMTFFVDVIDVVLLVSLVMHCATSSSPERLFPGITSIMRGFCSNLPRWCRSCCDPHHGQKDMGEGASYASAIGDRGRTSFDGNIGTSQEMLAVGAGSPAQSASPGGDRYWYARQGTNTARSSGGSLYAPQVHSSRDHLYTPRDSEEPPIANTGATQIIVEDDDTVVIDDFNHAV